MNDPSPKNEAEKQAAKDAQSALENERKHAVVWLCIMQSNGLWLEESYDDGELHNVSLPSVKWDIEANSFNEVVTECLKTLSSEFMDMSIERKMFRANDYQGKRDVALLKVASGPSTEAVLRSQSNQLVLRWYNTDEANEVGYAEMSREDEWQNDLVKKLRTELEA